MSGIDAHLSFGIGDLEKIHQGEHSTLEGSQHRRGPSGAHLGLILTQGDIATPVETILNGPMRPDEAQQISWPGLLGRETGDPIDHLSATHAFFHDAALQAKDLLNADPVLGKEVAQLRTGGQGARFQPPVSFLTGSGPLPVTTISLPILKKEGQVLVHGGLIVLGHQQIEPFEQGDGQAECALGVHRIGTDQPPGHVLDGQQVGSSTALVLFALHLPLGEQRARLLFVEREQMHRFLIGPPMLQGSSQRFPIQGYLPCLLLMGLQLLQRGRHADLLGRGQPREKVPQDARHFFLIKLFEHSGGGGRTRKARSLQAEFLPQPLPAQPRPLRHSTQFGLPCQFGQQDQGQDQGYAVADSPFLPRVAHLLECCLQRLRVYSAAWLCWVEALSQCGIVHTVPSLLVGQLFFSAILARNAAASRFSPFSHDFCLSRLFACSRLLKLWGQYTRTGGLLPTHL